MGSLTLGIHAAATLCSSYRRPCDSRTAMPMRAMRAKLARLRRNQTDGGLKQRPATAFPQRFASVCALRLLLPCAVLSCVLRAVLPGVCILGHAQEMAFVDSSMPVRVRMQQVGVAPSAVACSLTRRRLSSVVRPGSRHVGCLPASLVDCLIASSSGVLRSGHAQQTRWLHRCTALRHSCRCARAMAPRRPSALNLTLSSGCGTIGTIGVAVAIDCRLGSSVQARSAHCCCCIVLLPPGSSRRCTCAP